MKGTLLLAVALGGASGAVVRFLVSGMLSQSALQGSLSPGIPLGTLSVNAAGSLILGALTAIVRHDPRLPAEVRLLIGTGFCGGLTTFSTFAVETIDLPPAIALGNIAANLIVSLAMAAFGMWLASSLPGLGTSG